MSFLLSYPPKPSITQAESAFVEVQSSRGDVLACHQSEIKSETGSTEKGQRTGFNLPMSVSPSQHSSELRENFSACAFPQEGGVRAYE